MSTLLNIDASARGGGGQTVRIIIALAAATGRGVNVTNIRYRRSNVGGGSGGLKTSDVLNVEWLANACQARVEGMEPGSTFLKFEPGADLTRIKPEWTSRTCPSGQCYRHHTVNLEGGGVSIFLQAVLPFLLFTGSTGSRHWTRNSGKPLLLTLLGYTHFTGSATIDFIDKVIAPNLATLFPTTSEDRPLVQLYRDSEGHDDDLSIKHEWFSQYESRGRATFVIWPLDHGELLKAFIVPDLSASTWPRKCSLSIDLIGPPSPQSPSYFEDAASQLVPDYFPNVSPNYLNFQQGLSENENDLYVLLVLITPDGYRIGRSEFYWPYDGSPSLREKAEQVLTKACRELVTEVIRGGLRFDSNMLDQLPVLQGLAAGWSVIQPNEEEAKRMAILNAMSNGAAGAWWWRQQIFWVNDLFGPSVEGDGDSTERTFGAVVQHQPQPLRPRAAPSRIALPSRPEPRCTPGQPDGSPGAQALPAATGAGTPSDATTTTTNNTTMQPTQAPARTARRTRARTPADTSHVLSAREAVRTLLGAEFDNRGNCKGVGFQAWGI